MPADILGTNMIVEDQAGQREFQFQKGPIFTQICLADEINRATPKTQSALLGGDAGASRSASPGNVYQLKQPFFVMATQNPIEQEGTYPLPEAQLDRFFFKLVVGYSSRDELNTIIERTTKGTIVKPDKVMDGAEIVQWQQLVREVILAPHVQDYIARLTLATHPGWAVRRADHESVSALGQQPARCADADAGGQSAGALERPVQRQLRRRAPRLPAGDAAPRDSQLRGRGRRDRPGQGAAGSSGEGAGEGGRPKVAKVAGARSWESKCHRNASQMHDSEAESFAIGLECRRDESDLESDRFSIASCRESRAMLCRASSLMPCH